MAFVAKLKIGSKDGIDVISCNYELHREVDAKGRPSSIVYGGTIDLVVESTDDTSIIESMVNNQHKPLDGTITYKKGDEDSKMKELSFQKGYVIRYSENFDTNGKNPMLVSFTISAQTLKIGAASHKNEWPGAGGS